MALFHSDAIGSLKMDAREFTRKIISYFASLLASFYGLFRQPENGFQKYILFVFMLLQIILRCFGIVGTLFAIYPTSTMQMPKELQPSRVRVPSLPHQWQSSSVGRARLFLHLCCNVRPFRANAGWFTGRRAAQAVSAVRRRSGSSPDGVQTLWRNLIEPANLVAHPFLWHKKQMPKELQHRVPEVAGSNPAAATSMAAWRSRLARGKQFLHSLLLACRPFRANAGWFTG